MPRTIFVNLPVRDLDRAKEFFGSLDFEFNLQFTDDSAACMVIGEHIYAMLLTHDKFRAFTPHDICDANQQTEVLVALTCESRAEVDELVGKAVANGGKIYSEAQDHGVMYGHGFKDPDGHIWELMYMEPEVSAAE